ncbi:hypothetical protein GGR52DRAFT_573962 [Hypoxylon sp. FL1284]|nr:hypothetical protein GGR52DRAFT_573962 [Hypoxylon sp. FL1284]
MSAPLQSAPQNPADVKIPSYPGYEPTEDVPWLDEDQRHMFRLLDREPIISLCEYIQKTASDCQGTEFGRDMLHALAGLVLGTLGWQARLPSSHPLSLPQPIYNSDGPGTYVATIAIEGRGGKGLSADEYTTIADKIQACVEAHDEMISINCSRYTPAMTQKLEDARRIDRIYPPSVPRNDDIPSLPRKAKNIHAPLAQSISYVGSAVRSIESQSIKREPQHRFEFDDCTWWMTMSCIRDMNLVPDVVVVPAVRIWSPEHLKTSEVLMNIVGRTAVERWGLNCKMPGWAIARSELPDRNWDGDRMDAWTHRSYLVDQLTESREDLGRSLYAFREIPRRVSILQDLRQEHAATLETLSQLTVSTPDLDDIRREITLNNNLIESLKKLRDDLDRCSVNKTFTFLTIYL